MGYVHQRTEKLFCWENIEVGDEYGPVVGVITDFEVKSHAYAVDDYGPWYFQDQTPFGGRIGQPTLLGGELLSLYQLGYQMPNPRPGMLQARNETEFFRPVYVGQEVTLRGRNVGKFQKRGRNYRVLEGEALDQEGRCLLRIRAEATVPVESAPAPPAGEGPSTPAPARAEASRPEAPTVQVPADAPVVQHATRQIPLGAVLPSLPKRTSLEQNIIYSGFRYGWAEGGSRETAVASFTDPAEARRKGLPDAIVQGMVPNAYLSELCTSFFGPLWLTTGRLSVVFTRPVFVRDTVIASGLVKGLVEEEGRPRMELEVWCKNQRGELVVVGQASAQVE